MSWCNMGALSLQGARILIGIINLMATFTTGSRPSFYRLRYIFIYLLKRFCKNLSFRNSNHSFKSMLILIRIRDRETLLLNVACSLFFNCEWVLHRLSKISNSEVLDSSYLSSSYIYILITDLRVKFTNLNLIMFLIKTRMPNNM